MYLSFQFKMSNRDRQIGSGFEEFFCSRSILSNDNIISA